MHTSCLSTNRQMGFVGIRFFIFCARLNFSIPTSGSQFPYCARNMRSALSTGRVLIPPPRIPSFATTLVSSAKRVAKHETTKPNQRPMVDGKGRHYTYGIKARPNTPGQPITFPTLACRNMSNPARGYTVIYNPPQPRVGRIWRIVQKSIS